MPDDTHRDPLAALHGMDSFEAYRTGWAAAMALVRDRPSGDEALRAAAQDALTVMDAYASPLSGNARQRRPAMLQAARRLRSALAATPVPADD